MRRISKFLGRIRSLELSRKYKPIKRKIHAAYRKDASVRCFFRRKYYEHYPHVDMRKNVSLIRYCNSRYCDYIEYAYESWKRSAGFLHYQKLERGWE